MQIETRRCENCVHFNEYSSDRHHPVCDNLVKFVAHVDTPQEIERDPQPGDLCIEHQTPDEFAAEDELIKSHYRAIGPLAATECADACAKARALIRRVSWAGVA